MFYLTTVSVKVKVNVPVHAKNAYSGNRDMIRYGMIYLLTATGLRPGGSSTVHIYTQTVHRTAQ